MKQSRGIKPLSIINRLGLTIASLIVFIPFLWMICTSLKPDNEVYSNNWFGSHLAWGNYGRALSFFPFGTFFFNSLLVSVIGTILVLFTSSLSGYAFSRLRFRGRDQLFGAYLLTLMVPQQVVVVPLFLLMKQLGWVNSYWA